MKNLLDIHNFIGSEIKQYSINEVLAYNQESQKYGLALSPIQAQELVETRNRAIAGHDRVELNLEVLKKIIAVFSTSSYIHSGNYADTLNELIDLFYYMKTETEDSIGDDDLIAQMKKFFDTSCEGSVELLKNREMTLFARKQRCKMQIYDYLAGREQL
ncbi:MAG: DUF6323 family protein [Syntrophomonas sp.]